MIDELIAYLNKSRSPWDYLEDNLSKQLTEIFCNFDDDDFLILNNGIVYNIYKKKADYGDYWKSEIIGRPDVLLEMKNAAILPELESRYSAINWMVVEEGDITSVSTPFMTEFTDRINAIIDTTYANLK